MDPCCSVCETLEVVCIDLIEYWAGNTASRGIGSKVERIGGAVAALEDSDTVSYKEFGRIRKHLTYILP